MPRLQQRRESAPWPRQHQTPSPCAPSAWSAAPPRGVFATRAPARPNRIGLSIVRLLSVDGRVLHFEGNDMVDGTPVLDIKPYVPQLDVRETTRIGWFARRVEKVGETRSDDRMA